MCTAEVETWVRHSVGRITGGGEEAARLHEVLPLRPRSAFMFRCSFCHGIVIFPIITITIMNDDRCMWAKESPQVSLFSLVPGSNSSPSSSPPLPPSPESPITVTIPLMCLPGPLWESSLVFWQHLASLRFHTIMARRRQIRTKIWCRRMWAGRREGRKWKDPRRCDFSTQSLGEEDLVIVQPTISQQLHLILNDNFILSTSCRTYWNDFGISRSVVETERELREEEANPTFWKYSRSSNFQKIHIYKWLFSKNIKSWLNFVMFSWTCWPCSIHEEKLIADYFRLSRPGKAIGNIHFWKSTNSCNTSSTKFKKLW